MNSVFSEEALSQWERHAAMYEHDEIVQVSKETLLLFISEIRRLSNTTEKE